MKFRGISNLLLSLGLVCTGGPLVKVYVGLQPYLHEPATSLQGKLGKPWKTTYVWWFSYQMWLLGSSSSDSVDGIYHLWWGPRDPSSQGTGCVPMLSLGCHPWTVKIDRINFTPWKPLKHSSIYKFIPQKGRAENDTGEATSSPSIMQRVSIPFWYDTFWLPQCITTSLTRKIITHIVIYDHIWIFLSGLWWVFKLLGSLE